MPDSCIFPRAQLVVGFHGTSIPDWLVHLCAEGWVKAVILFDYSFHTKSYQNNILSPAQLGQLTRDIHSLPGRPLVCVDQEGGKVRRLKESLGFAPLPSAKDYAQLPKGPRMEILKRSFAEMKQLGIDWVLGPVVDILYHPNSPDIGAFDRSFSVQPEIVMECALEWCALAQDLGLELCLKHYPGLGAATVNSHWDLTQLAVPVREQLKVFSDLLPYVPGKWILLSHAFVPKWDQEFPISLSAKVVSQLRQVIPQARLICDDLQMQGILKKYPLQQAWLQAHHVGLDAICVGNNLADEKTFLRDCFKI